MPRLLPTTTVLAAALLATAATAQEAAPAVEAAVSVQAEASAPALSAAPVAMKVNVGYVEDMASYGKVVVVPTAYVKLLVDGSVFIAKQGSGLGALGGASTNSVKAKGSYKVAGIDKAFAQGLAKQAYDDFVTQLRGAGYTVLTYDDIKSRDFVPLRPATPAAVSGACPPRRPLVAATPMWWPHPATRWPSRSASPACLPSSSSMESQSSRTLPW